MGTAGRHKVQVFSSDVVEELRTLLTQKTTEPVPQPDSFMIGAVIQDAVASSRGVAEKRLFIEHADSCAGREGGKDQFNSSFGVPGEICWAG